MWKIRSMNRVVRVRNWTRTLKSQILKWYKNKTWYKYVMLWKEQKYKNIRLNRLVAQSFLGLDINIPEQVVMHLNNNKMDNRVENLKIGTSQENTDQCKQEWRFITHKKRRKSLKYRLQTLRIRFFRLIWLTNWQIAKLENISESYASLIFNKRRRAYVK